MIHLEKKIIYIANPKTGSDAIRGYLQRTPGFQSERQFLDRERLFEVCMENDFPNKSWLCVDDQLEHLPAFLYQAYLRSVHNIDMAEFTVFSTVRNPWLKAISAFKYSLTNNHGVSSEQVNQDNEVLITLFREYIQHTSAWKGYQYIYPDYVHLRNYQYMCLGPDDKDLCNQIFDIKETPLIPSYLQTLGVECLPVIPRTNTIQKGNPKNRQKFFNDEARRIIYEANIKSIDKFGYTFDEIG